MSGLRTSNAPGTVHLTWDPGSTRTTKGYLVGRKLPGEGAFQALMVTPITSAGYVDQLPAGKEVVDVTYQVVSVDKKDRLSLATEVQPVISAPDPPSGY